MELDDFQNRWAAQDQKLDEVLRLNRKLLRAGDFGRARSALQRLRATLAFELALNALAVAALGAFLGGHLSEGRFLIPALVLDVAAVAILGASVRQWVLARAVDFTGPVTTSQRQLEDLRVLRIRTTQWVLLLAPLLWTPLLIVGLRVLLGVDAYAALGMPYLVLNLVFGVAFVPLMRWAAHRWAHRFEKTGMARRWVEALAGTSLTAALGQLSSIADFERESERRATPA